jgi:hypothetical protein
MELFEIKDYSLTFAPQALALKPFKAIWDSDKSKDKHKAVMELSYVYFFADGRSDFVDILNLEERSKEISTSLSLPSDWKPSRLVEEAIEFYIKREDTIANRLLRAGIEGAEKIANFIKEVDLNATDDKGKYTNNIKQIQDTIANLPKTVSSLIAAQKEVKKEQANASGARGSVEKGLFEDED